MTTYTSISGAAVAVGGIPSSATVTALRDNPIAIAEAANGAPVVFAGWHPVDKVSIGDGADGLIYDGAVDGALASVETPDFADGYEYRIVANVISGSTSGTPRLGLYGATSASWNDIDLLTFSMSSGNTLTIDINILMPRLAKTYHFFKATGVYLTGSPALGDVPEGFASVSPAQKIGKARIIFSAGNVDAGKIWLFRRREYASSP